MTAVRLEDGDGALLAYLCDEIDHHTAREIRSAVDTRLTEVTPSELILDFSSVSFMDSSGIGLILGRSELCRTLGIRVRVRGHTGIIARLIRMSGVSRLENITVE